MRANEFSVGHDHRTNGRTQDGLRSRSATALRLQIVVIIALLPGTIGFYCGLTAPIGKGPGKGNPNYVPYQVCGTTTEAQAMEHLGPYNDYNSNPGYLPVTEVRFRRSASIQWFWQGIEGEEHGLRNSSIPQERFVLKPGEVIVKVALVVRPDGQIANWTFFTNESRQWSPVWDVPPHSTSQLFVASPETSSDCDQSRKGWYLAYTTADVVGYCVPNQGDASSGPAYYITPLLYFYWTTEPVKTLTAPASPPSASGPSPSNAAAPRNSTAARTPTPQPHSPPSSKGPKLGLILGAALGAAVLSIVAALAWVCIRLHRAKATQLPIAKSPTESAQPAPAAPPAPPVAAAAFDAATAAPAGSGGPDSAQQPIPEPSSLPRAAAAASVLVAPSPAPPRSHASTHSSIISYPSTPRFSPNPSSAASVPLPSRSWQTGPAAPPPNAAASSTQPLSTLKRASQGPPFPNAAAGTTTPVTQPQPAPPATPLSPQSSSAISVATSSIASVPVWGPTRAAPGMAPAPGMMSPGVMGGAGGAGSVSLASMAAMSAAGVAVMSTVYLAKEILDAGDRVVANHTRCLRLTSRIKSMLPLLSTLQADLDNGCRERAADNIKMLNQIEAVNAVFQDVRSCIDRWCGNEATGRRQVLLKVLRNLAVSKRFEDEFLDLNERLSECYQDLILALNIKHATASINPDRMKRQHEEDVAADLKGVAEELTTAEGEEAWSQLPTEGQATILEAFRGHGLDFNTIMSQARKNAMGERVKDLVIPWAELHIMAEVGSGSYGTVHRGVWQGVDVAVKKLHLTVVTERAKRELSNEAYVMSLLRHPNVATSYGMVLEPPHCALVMEFYERGTLLELLHDDSYPLTLRRKLQLATDVAKGMAYLHSRPAQPVIHGDLKPSNLLLHEDGRVVISDFGLSRVSTLTLSTKAASSGMSVVYAAPEILADPMARRTPATDVYAYGLVLFEIFTREPPFGPSAAATAIVQYVLGGGRPRVAGPEVEERRVPAEVVELMQDCWQQVPEERPNFASIVNRLAAVSAPTTVR